MKVESNSDLDDEFSNISDSDSLKPFIDNEEVNTELIFIVILIIQKLILTKLSKTNITMPFMMLRIFKKFQIYVKVLKIRS